MNSYVTSVKSYPCVCIANKSKETKQKHKNFEVYVQCEDYALCAARFSLQREKYIHRMIKCQDNDIHLFFAGAQRIATYL